MPHPSNPDLTEAAVRRPSPARIRRALARLSRSAGSFDARRYFRGGADLRFYNVGAGVLREMAKAIYRAHRGAWTIDRALPLADALIRDDHLEMKGVGIELLACYRADFTPRLLSVWKRWLAQGHSNNWATTDGICGSLIGPLVLASPALVPRVAAWSRHRNMWVRRASAVGLIASARRGSALDAVYGVAKRLHGDREDLIQKAVGWMLREAGKADPVRLEGYLRANVTLIPRSTFRYAIERFDESRRRRLMALPFLGIVKV
jgi:3-methyladenine DNA glycosylase AlkD